MTALARPGIAWRRERSRRRWWKRHGDYRAFRGLLARHLDRLSALSVEELVVSGHGGLALAPLAISELLCRLMPREHWLDYDGPKDLASLLRRAWERDRDDLLLNLAAAADWLDFWERHLDEHGFSHVVVFSGSYIYTRTLLALAERRGLRAFVLESFFTGNEFYCEPRYSPIANSSLLADAAWRQRMVLPPEHADRMRAEAHRRLRDMRNKNVRPVAGKTAPFFREPGPTVLVIGQVLNDFGMIEGKAGPLFALPFYFDAMRRLLAETEARVIFKAHPWERRRPNLKRPLTLERMREFAAGLPAAQRGRLRILETEPIRVLFRQADWVVTLCSQGALEACQAGLKPVQLGRAFYEGAGFTHDYESLSDFLVDMKAGRISGRLEPRDYRAFEDFLAGALLIHLFTDDAASVERLVAMLKGEAPPAAVVDFPQLEQPPLPWRRILRDMIASPCPWLRDGLRFLRRPHWRDWAAGLSIAATDGRNAEAGGEGRGEAL